MLSRKNMATTAVHCFIHTSASQCVQFTERVENKGLSISLKLGIGHTWACFLAD